MSHLCPNSWERAMRDSEAYLETYPVSIIKSTLIQIWKSAKIFVFIWKWYFEDFTLKHVLLFEICSREICEKFVYKHSQTMEYVQN